MKKAYNELDIELIRFGSMDIVTASGDNVPGQPVDDDDPDD